MNNACSWDEENEELAKLAAEIKKNIAALRKIEQMEEGKEKLMKVLY